jgi:uncharacterized repeat protein (TIGR03803 family)
MCDCDRVKLIWSREMVQSTVGLLPLAVSVVSMATCGTAQTFTVLHTFNGANDGSSPNGGLVLSGSTLYGTAQGGGQGGAGTVFAVNTNGTAFTVLHAFTGGSDGGQPNGGLALWGITLYGTTYSGGSKYGTVFAVNIDGTGWTVLHNFIYHDGASPNGGLVFSGSTLYGTTQAGGGANCGVVFSVMADGTGFAQLALFNGDWMGATPLSGLTLANTTLYGTASAGSPQTVGPGPTMYGTIFSLSTRNS